MQNKPPVTNPNPRQPILDLQEKYKGNPAMQQYIKTFEDNHDDLEDFQCHIMLLAELQIAIAQMTNNFYYNPDTILKS